MKIALIEDEPNCYENYQVLLEEQGHEVSVYSEADEVVREIEKICKADVIVLDLMLQLGTMIKPSEAIETGTAIYKRIRNINQGVPIVVLTARSQGDVWTDFAFDKHARYLGKPVSDLDNFIKTIVDWS